MKVVEGRGVVQSAADVPELVRRFSALLTMGVELGLEVRFELAFVERTNDDDVDEPQANGRRPTVH